jgi:orotate phosphoribosyltransferase
MSMSRSELAAAIYHVSHLTGSFVLRSGQTATEYFDKYRFEADPGLLAEIAAGLAERLPADVEILAGLELGGVPIATALSRHTGLPAAFVRKKAKTYGTAQLAEGAEVQGKRVVVVEDVVTSGGQVVISTGDLRALGADVATALCVIDRESGGGAALTEAGLELRALYTMTELKAAAGGLPA